MKNLAITLCLLICIVQSISLYGQSKSRETSSKLSDGSPTRIITVDSSKEPSICDPNRPFEQCKPDPTVLAVTLRIGKSVFLNNEPSGSLDDLSSLTRKLIEVFRERKQQRVFLPGTTEIISTVWISTQSYERGRPNSLTKLDVQRIIGALEAAGAHTIKITNRTPLLADPKPKTATPNTTLPVPATLVADPALFPKSIQTNAQPQRKAKPRGISSSLGRLPSITNNGVLVFPATYPRWFSLGKGPLTLVMGNPYPSIQIDRLNSGVTPSYGLTRSFNRRSLAPKLTVGAFVAKIGINGQPFVPFAEYRYFTYTNIFPDYRFDTNEEVYVGINDFDYSDNRGAYQFQILDRGSISGAQLVGTENCYGEQCQTWNVSLVKSDGWYDTGIPVKANQKIHVRCGDDHCTDVQSGIISLNVGDVTLENEENTNHSLSFATQDYVDWKDMHGRGGKVDYIVVPSWSATLKVKINNSFPKTYIKNLVVTVGPAGGM